MPPKRKSETKAAKASKAGAPTKKVKKHQPASSDGDASKTGPWTLEEEKLLFFCILASCDAKFTVAVQDEAAKLLGRNAKANYWYGKIAKQLKEFKDSKDKNDGEVEHEDEADSKDEAQSAGEAQGKDEAQDDAEEDAQEDAQDEDHGDE